MLRELFQYVIGLGEQQAEQQVIEIDGVNYSRYKFTELKPEPICRPREIKLNTLGGLIDYIKNNPDELNISDLIIHIEGPNQVMLMSCLYEDNSREHFIRSEAMLPHINFDKYLDIEQFNVQLQSCFVQTEQAAAVLKVVGNIKDENVKVIGDDGVSQEVTVRKGIQKADNAIVPNPVVLAPFRTFAEVPQPESKFILRLKDGPSAGLYEADGGAWRIEAMQNIKAFLQAELEGTYVKIIS